MAATTLTQARTLVRELIDSPGTTRWNDTQVDYGLSGALSRCQSTIHKHGTDRFDLITTGTSSATDGTLTVSNAMAVKDVCVTVGNITYRLPPKMSPRRGYVDLVARSLEVRYVREYELSSTASDPLVGVGATAANTWKAFDDWVIAEAACQLLVKSSDDKKLAMARTHADRCMAAVLERPSTPGASQPWPRPEHSPVVQGLQWQWVPSTTKVHLLRYP